jgi:lincosamide nucleotidyltransferase A/C/D/E
MNATSVLHILDLLALAGAPVWFDGGWGVDALLGRITRPHNDLDLVLALADLTSVVEVLVRNGFRVEEEEPGRVVLEHADHGRIDLHPVTFDPLGNAVQVQPAASPVVYRRDGFVSGRILGRAVACISADVQVFARLGHDRSEKHRQDVVALCSSFGLPVPEDWDVVRAHAQRILPPGSEREENVMNEHDPMKHGGLSLTRQIHAPREKVYEAWTKLEHRKHWFAGPGWTEINRSLDLKTNGTEIAHGRFEDGTETIYTARFHLIEPNFRLIYAFDMQVGGQLFSISLAGVEFKSKSTATELTYTEQGLFLVGEYDAESRTAGTNGLLNQFSSYVETMK